MKKIISLLTGSKTGQAILERIVIKLQIYMGIGGGACVTTSGEDYLAKLIQDIFNKEKKRLCILDVGSNTGGFTNMITPRISNLPHTIHAFEPSIKSFNLLYDNTKNNNNIVINNFALGKTCGRQALYYEESGSELSSLTKRNLDHYNTNVSNSEIVNVETIDNYCRNKQICRIDLLKIDAEGHELDVLMGAQKMIENNNINMISFEFGGCNIDTNTYFRDFWYFFKNYSGAKIFRVTPSGYLSRVWKYRERYEQFQTTNYLVIFDDNPSNNEDENLYSFEKGMKYSSEFNKKNKVKDWTSIIKRFNQIGKNEKQSSKIPKILHQIWLGGEVPKQFNPHIKKLRNLHPHWEYRLWTDNNIDFKLINQNLFDMAKNMGQKSDILRYEILNKYGGVYLDLDHVAIRSFDDLIGFDSFAGVTYDQNPQVTNSVIGSIPNSSLTKELCNLDFKFIENPSVIDIFRTTGPDYFTKVFLSLFEAEENIIVLPNSYFNPFPNFSRDRIRGNNYKKYIQDETICCHLWNCAWAKNI
jgi:FkbM family methyltransferase